MYQSMRVSVLSISALEDQCYDVSFFGCGVHILSVRGQEPGPPLMIGISEDRLYKLWGKPIYQLQGVEGMGQLDHMREQEALLSRPTWWEWTQLEEWGYPEWFSTGGNNSYRAEQVEYPDLERMGLSDSEGETHSDVDHGGGVLEYVARAGTSTLGVSSSVEGAPMMSRQLSDGGDHLSQHEIKSQPLDVT
jgi:hypothetical protein